MASSSMLQKPKLPSSASKEGNSAKIHKWLLTVSEEDGRPTHSSLYTGKHQFKRKRDPSQDHGSIEASDNTSNEEGRCFEAKKRRCNNGKALVVNTDLDQVRPILLPENWRTTEFSAVLYNMPFSLLRKWDEMDGGRLFMKTADFSGQLSTAIELRVLDFSTVCRTHAHFFLHFWKACLDGTLSFGVEQDQVFVDYSADFRLAPAQRDMNGVLFLEAPQALPEDVAGKALVPFQELIPLPTPRESVCSSEDDSRYS